MASKKILFPLTAGLIALLGFALGSVVRGTAPAQANAASQLQAQFVEVARRVSRIEPIVMVKGGSSEAGSRAASSHTGSLAGQDRAYQAAFGQSGVIRWRYAREKSR